MSSYKDLIVWQKSIDLCEVVYKTTEIYPREELFGLTSQMRRCSVSIASNIAEGQRKGHILEYLQFLRSAYASGAELETQLIISSRIDYLPSTQFEEINLKLQEIMKMLNKLIATLQPSAKT